MPPQFRAMEIKSPGMLAVSVVVPTWNRCELLEKCLAALLRQTFPIEDWEIIVVDDGSGDHTPGFLQPFIARSKIRIRGLRQENRGPAAARNLGIRNARGTIIAFLDDDCIPFPNWLEEITSNYSEGVGGIGGRIIPRQTNSWIGQYCAHKKSHETPVFLNASVDYLITANASFSRKALNDSGGFDEQYRYPGGEDPDLSRRIRKMGYTLKYNPSAGVNHQHRETLMSLTRTYYRYGLGEAINYQKRKAHRPRLINFAVTLLWVIAFPLSILKTPWDLFRYYQAGLNGPRPLLYCVADFLCALFFRVAMARGAAALLRRSS